MILFKGPDLLYCVTITLIQVFYSNIILYQTFNKKQVLFSLLKEKQDKVLMK